ncbi:MAG: type I methionyl aminopeptidase [Candidatus Pacebacteria bacterium]|jgi:methionyl aminopeptidase|nr:type I methionyl aminopeptidase [Candidatus Paceibacterota bacterium]MBT3511555.1 type I methionyl aminopeptidase [Candidatus Paceibacterota bacterium]MBT4004975.1 type I methionyl aminopeptidase [Candidatus Paceibacterota bacterium]MBT4358751.1 type I methionyl aminopeptidase [Candidatus Paceibacterota bacterium]MBT4680914.1 type I methionyl aminopeptidase [Candidatus Paceibacterota bacterium]
MIIKSQTELATYKKATQLSKEILSQLREAIKPGVYPIELDILAGELCKKNGVRSSFKGVVSGHLTYGFNSCISVNDEILHGIPSDKRKIQAGDLVKIDFGIIYQGFYTDHCFTVGVGSISAEDQKLLEIGREAVLNAVKLAKPGNTAGDLGFAMHNTSYKAGFDTLKQYVGHGIGKSLHENPEIPAFGKPGAGAKLEKNMIICVECQVVTGDDRVYIENNGWTVKTKDSGKGVMFEYMVRVDKKPEILTPTQDWPLTV